MGNSLQKTQRNSSELSISRGICEKKFKTEGVVDGERITVWELLMGDWKLPGAGMNRSLQCISIGLQRPSMVRIG